MKIVPLSRFSPSPYLATTTSDNTLNDLEHELALMKLIFHPNILALYDVWESQRETYVEHCTLPNFLYTHPDLFLLE